MPLSVISCVNSQLLQIFISFIAFYYSYILFSELSNWTSPTGYIGFKYLVTYVVIYPTLLRNCVWPALAYGWRHCVGSVCACACVCTFSVFYCRPTSCSHYGSKSYLHCISSNFSKHQVLVNYLVEIWVSYVQRYLVRVYLLFPSLSLSLCHISSSLFSPPSLSRSKFKICTFSSRV